MCNFHYLHFDYIPEESLAAVGGKYILLLGCLLQCYECNKSDSRNLYPKLYLAQRRLKKYQLAADEAEAL